MNRKKPHNHQLWVIARANLAVALLAPFIGTCEAQSGKVWQFDKYNDRQGWTVPSNALGVVMGGALWVALNPRETDPAKIANPMYQAHGDAERGIELLSPRGIGVATTEGGQVQVRLQVLNLSPATDFYLRWRTKEQLTGWGEDPSLAKVWNPDHLVAQSKHCALNPDLKKWQEMTCYVSKPWHGTIDQIGIYVPSSMRGDIWIKSVQIEVGPEEPSHIRPDVASAAVVPRISIPGISQAGFSEAFKVLDQCLIVDVPQWGFTHPFMSPGGLYFPTGWWELDTNLTVVGAKWANQDFAEGVMRGFHDVQSESPDGRFDESGVAETRGQVGDVSQPPVFFEVAYDVARRTSNLQLRSDIYQTMQQYLDWWLSPAKRDGRTGLVSGVVDETFGEAEYPTRGIMPQSVAPVGINVAVAVGAARTAALAAELGKESDAEKYRQVFKDLSNAINNTLWDEDDGVYYSYDLGEHHLRKRLIVSTFDPLRLGIAPIERRDRLLKRLLDPAQFNWGKRPLTSLAMTDPGYVEREGMVGGIDGWNGPVWTFLNMTAVAGLEESGHPDLAAELNWATVKEFHQHYREFVLPSSGEGGGAEGYGFAASQYIGAIIEHLFGVDFDRIQKRLRIEPHVPKALYGKDIALENLRLPSAGDTRLSVRIKQSANGSARVTVNMNGPLPEGSLEIALPGAAKKVAAPMPHSMTAVFP